MGYRKVGTVAVGVPTRPKAGRGRRSGLLGPLPQPVPEVLSLCLGHPCAPVLCRDLGRRQNTTSAESPLLSSPQAKASLVSPALGGPSRKTPPCPPRGTSHSGPPSSSAAAHHPGPPTPEHPQQPKTNGCAFQATSELHSILPCPAPGPAAQRPPKAAPLEVSGSDSSLSSGEVDFQYLDAYLYTALGYRRIPLWGPSELQKPPEGLKGLFRKVRAAFRRYKYKIPSPGDFQGGQYGPRPYVSNTPSQLRSHKKKIRKCLINLCCNW